MQPLHPDGALAKIIHIANTWEARARRAERSHFWRELGCLAIGCAVGLGAGVLLF